MNPYCPHCGTDLAGDLIPAEYIAAGMYGPGVTHYRREIGVVLRGVYDGVLFWQCPACDGKWHRWPEGSRNHRLAQPYMDAS